MTDRPTLGLRGRRYQRERGVWVDVATHMVASAAVSIELDSLAKRDSVFWVRCRTQDFNDNPRKRGKLVRIVASNQVSPNVSPVPAQEPVKRR